MLNNFLNKTNYISSNPKPSLKMSMIVDDEMALSEHIEEFSQRLVFCLLFLIFVTVICFTDIKEIVRFFQAPAVGVKFLQFAPGEYFFAVMSHTRCFTYSLLNKTERHLIQFIKNLSIRESSCDIDFSFLIITHP